MAYTICHLQLKPLTLILSPYARGEAKKIPRQSRIDTPRVILSVAKDLTIAPTSARPARARRVNWVAL